MTSSTAVRHLPRSLFTPYARRGFDSEALVLVKIAKILEVATKRIAFESCREDGAEEKAEELDKQGVSKYITKNVSEAKGVNIAVWGKSGVNMVHESKNV